VESKEINSRNKLNEYTNGNAGPYSRRVVRVAGTLFLAADYGAGIGITD
jgi:hypothetical protein